MDEEGGGQAAGGPGGGSPAGGVPDAPKGVLLAIAIILLWLAGVAFFIAFEGSKILTESSGTDSSSMLRTMINALGQKSVDRAAAAGASGGGG
jgi:hypothetical protein